MRARVQAIRGTSITAVKYNPCRLAGVRALSPVAMPMPWLPGQLQPLISYRVQPDGRVFAMLTLIAHIDEA